MKPNLEISLKFWTAMTAFFCIVLSVLLSDYLIGKNIINYRELYGICLICITMLIGTIAIISFRYSELKNRHKNSKFFSDMSFQTLEDYETQIKAQEDHIKELKKSFEDAVVEITDLRSKNKQLDDTNNILIEKFKYWKERALHQKHTKKEVEDNVYLCIKSIGEYFIEGKKYKRRGKNKDLLHLVGESGLVHIVNKLHFKPAK